jgi:hypothetical protein
MTVHTSSARSPEPDEFHEIAQMGELTDFCRGQITGAFVEVLLPTGKRMRLDAVAFTGSVGGQNRTMVLRAIPSLPLHLSEAEQDGPLLADLRHAWIEAGSHYADAAIQEATERITRVFATAVKFTTEGTYEEIGADLSVTLKSVELEDGTTVDKGQEFDELCDELADEGLFQEAVLASLDVDSWDYVQDHEIDQEGS